MNISDGMATFDPTLHANRQPANIHWHHGDLDRLDRAVIKGQKPCVIWLTGLSASGKSTIANALEQRLYRMGRHTMLLDGDNVRHGLNKDLGFTEGDRVENIRRIGEVAKLMADAGLIVITAFISPYQAERDMVRRLMSQGEFVEIYISTPLEICEQRDPKGIYKKARRGEITNFTGISAPYEEPQNPEITLDTSDKTVENASEIIIDFLTDAGVL